MSLIENIKSYTAERNLDSEKKELFNSFLAKGFPTIKDEEWKYTSLKNVIKPSYLIGNRCVKLDSSKIENHSLGLAHRIIFSDGKLLKYPAIKGLTISGFSEFKCKNNDAFSELNAALSNSGFSISIDKNTVIENPIEILFFNSTKNSFSQYRNQISVGENSEIKIVEKIQDLSNSSTLVNHFTQINIGENAKMEYNKIQDNTKNSCLIDSLNIVQESDSIAIVNTFIFGGAFSRNNLNFEQDGSNCESNMNGISLLDDNQFADNHTFVDHKHPHCRSNELYKGIYLGSSKGVFNGKIMVRPDAQKIDAFQSNNTLLLSDSSTIDSKPQLEIYADDVKCSHGCTIGQLDKDALFYMRSRGIAENDAKAVLTYAFASEAINNINIPQVKASVKKRIAEKLKVDLELEN